MRISFDTRKRDWTLRERGLDFAEADLVFDGTTIDIPDLRQDYGELRIKTVGYLRGLVANSRVVKFLGQHYTAILTEFQKVTETEAAA